MVKDSGLLRENQPSYLHKYTMAHGILFFSSLCTEIDFNSPRSDKVSNDNNVSYICYVYLNRYCHLIFTINIYNL